MKGYENRQHYHDTCSDERLTIKELMQLDPCSILFPNCSSSLFWGIKKSSYLHEDPLNLLDLVTKSFKHHSMNHQKWSQKSSKILGSSVLLGKFRPGRAIHTASAVFGDSADVPHGADAAALGERTWVDHGRRTIEPTIHWKNIGI